jgi:thiamine biosynthesis protein ThiS
MEIIVNGEQKKVEAGTSVEGYLTGLDLNLETVVIECDGDILKREEYPLRILQEGCVLEVIRFIGGG